MQFEWDEQKRLANLAKHGIDFKDAINVLGQNGPLYESVRSGEMRWVTIGIQDDVLIAVVWTLRGETCRLISARRARKHEREDYARHVGGHTVG
ncbi:MAG: BrnT family toxin [Phreatobacter sp.]|nr:BrnT family toxin [Phreatobacter sp.]